jgi:hypothetical protein
MYRWVDVCGGQSLKILTKRRKEDGRGGEREENIARKRGNSEKERKIEEEREEDEERNKR